MKNNTRVLHYTRPESLAKDKHSSFLGPKKMKCCKYNLLHINIRLGPKCNWGSKCFVASGSRVTLIIEADNEVLH